VSGLATSPSIPWLVHFFCIVQFLSGLPQHATEIEPKILTNNKSLCLLEARGRADKEYVMAGNHESPFGGVMNA
jgi:hypothetical protein